jgi:hypothetical protein
VWPPNISVSHIDGFTHGPKRGLADGAIVRTGGRVSRNLKPNGRVTA